MRNHIADLWIYKPVTTRYSARYGRHVRSRGALRDDLQEISHIEARRHAAQTALISSAQLF